MSEKSICHLFSRQLPSENTQTLTEDIKVPLHGNFELRPLGATMGNASSVTRA